MEKVQVKSYEKRCFSKERDDEIPGFLASMLYSFTVGIFLMQCLGKRMQARVNMQPAVSKNEINYGLFSRAK